MLIEIDPHQQRIAVLEADRLTEVFIERRQDSGMVGTIFKGRVNRVLPGMQAAFVDIGLDRDAFLYVSDVVDHESEGVEEQDEAALLGVQDETESRAIEELLNAGQEILVQVTKDALGNKGARVTTNITLPSRSLVLLPTVHHVGISRRIEDEEERERLRELVESVVQPPHGLIVRTAGEGRSLEELEADYRYLRSSWEEIGRTAAKVSSPTLIHRDLDLALRTVRDLFNDEYTSLWVDSEEAYARIVEFLGKVQPGLIGRVRLDRKEAALFERFNLEREIEAALSSKVWLKSGGYLVINQTEALVAIDVNTGRYVGSNSLEETVLKTNLEAVREIVRQVRLRDLSGILIIDLIDMVEEVHREEVYEALAEEFKKDRAKSKILKISEFGVVEVTRKRSRTNLERVLTRRCPYCKGSGRIKTISSVCLEVRGEVLRMLRSGRRTGDLLLRAHPDVASALQREERAVLDEIESAAGGQMLIQGDPQLHQERFDLTEV